MSSHEPTVTPPIEPMLARLAEALPPAEGMLYEPKWDGFRAIVFRDASGVFIQSRDLRPLDRYFPELHDELAAQLPTGCVLDGEIIIATGHGLDFDALQLRLHPAASRVAKLAKETPASFVAFDVLAMKGEDLRSMAQEQRRSVLEKLMSGMRPPLHLTPMTRDRALALDWLQRFEGAGLDGVVAKPAKAPYDAGKRAMIKVKHARTAECVVGGFRWHKSGQDAVGSLLLGLYDDAGVLRHVGVTSSFTMQTRKQLAKVLISLKVELEDHPWRDAEIGAQSRWSAGKDLSFVPLRIERVCEVKYDHLQGDRFRHAATFLRWRPDKPPHDCRYDQLEVTRPFELARVLASSPASVPGSGGSKAATARPRGPRVPASPRVRAGR
jgi:ATP-dependent DNA ligase